MDHHWAPPTRNAAANRHTRPLRLRAAGAAVGAVLLLGGCGAADLAQQQVEQAVDAVAESARAQAEEALEGALGRLPDAQLQVSEDNRAAFTELRTGLEQVNAKVLALLAAPQDLSRAALEPLDEQLAELQASAQEKAASLTGVSVAEQEAWADLGQAIQATADQVGALANLLG